MALSSQVRPLVAEGEEAIPRDLRQRAWSRGGEPDDDRFRDCEADRERKWQALPRELKLAVKRVHVNLGHPDQAALFACTEDI